MNQKKITQSEAGKRGNEAGRAAREAAYQKRIADFSSKGRACPQCQAHISYDRRKFTFCNRSCAALYSNTTITRSPTNNQRQGLFLSSDKDIKSCLNCANQIFGDGSKYCTMKCHRESEYNDRVTKYESGEAQYSEQWTRRYLKRNFGHKCMDCGISEWKGEPAPLQMDHIDGDSTNNTLKNVRLLCCNCHALTPTFGRRNFGKGRAFRRKRYAEGKSY